MHCTMLCINDIIFFQLSVSDENFKANDLFAVCAYNVTSHMKNTKSIIYTCCIVFNDLFVLCAYNVTSHK